MDLTLTNSVGLLNFQGSPPLHRLFLGPCLFRGFGFVIDLEDEEKNNVIDAVIAHEIAHQWWAHQLVGANMQGTHFKESFSDIPL